MKAEDFWLLTFDLALQHVKVKTPGKTPVTVQVHGEVLHEWRWGLKVTEFAKCACSYVLDCLRYCPFSLVSFKSYDRQWWFEFSNSLKSIFTTVANNRNNLFGRIHAADADVSKAFITSISILINQIEGSTPVCGSLLPPLYAKDTGKRFLSEDRYSKDTRKVSNIASTYMIYPRRNSIHIITRQTNYVSTYF